MTVRSAVGAWRYYARESIKSIKDFLFRRVLLLARALVSSSWVKLKSGRTSVGSISFAPRAIIRDDGLGGIMVALDCGIGGATGCVECLTLSPWRDLGRKTVDARRSLFGAAKLAGRSTGAVCGVAGVRGVEGIRLLLARVSVDFFVGAMAIFARASLKEMLRRRRWPVGFLFAGDEASIEAFSYGSELRNDRAGESGAK